jgi:hypothetical protein
MQTLIESENKHTDETRTLEFAYEVIAGTVHEGPHFLISLFSPPYMLFLVFFLHNWIL